MLEKCPSTLQAGQFIGLCGAGGNAVGLFHFTGESKGDFQCLGHFVRGAGRKCREYQNRKGHADLDRGRLKQQPDGARQQHHANGDQCHVAVGRVAGHRADRHADRKEHDQRLRQQIVRRHDHKRAAAPDAGG
ncbi:hypothetical protein FQZ97_1159810 [compost metagenome]